MDIKYFGNNLIPGVNVKSVNAGVINPLMNAGAAVSQAYGQYGQNLRQGLGLELDDFSQQFLANKLKKEDKKPIKGFDTLTPEETAEAIKLSNQSVPDTTKGPKLDPNATEQYASNFKAGEANKDAMQDYFKGQKNGQNLATWAAANPALAYKQYSKAMGKEKDADMAAYAEDYGSPMNQQSEMVFEQGKPTVTTTSQFDVLNNPTELSAPGKAAYDLAMGNTNFIGQRDIPTADNTQEFLATMMKRFGLVK